MNLSCLTHDFHQHSPSACLGATEPSHSGLLNSKRHYPRMRCRPFACLWKMPSGSPRELGIPWHARRFTNPTRHFPALGILAQAVYSAAVGQSGLGHGAVEDVLAGAFAQGLQGLVAGEEEDFGVGLAVVIAEHGQEVVTEQGVALPTALGMGDEQPMAPAVQVFDVNVGGRGEAQAAAIDATQKGPGAQVALGADGEELFDFGHAVEPWDQGGAAGTLDLVQERLDVAL